MSTLLHIDTSINAERSHSRRVTAEFAGEWKQSHPDGGYIYRDLAREPIPHIDGATYWAHRTPPEQQSPQQAEAYRATKPIGDEVASADVILLGVPMYNFSVPSSLKSWLDHIAIPRFTADPQTGQGPLSHTRIIVASSRGGAYGAGTPKQAFDHQEPYLRSFFNFLGAEKKLTFLHTEMALSLVVPDLAQFEDIYQRSSQSCLDQARELARV